MFGHGFDDPSPLVYHIFRNKYVVIACIGRYRDVSSSVRKAKKERKKKLARSFVYRANHVNNSTVYVDM